MDIDHLMPRLLSVKLNSVCCSTVVVPPGDKAKPISCLICKEIPTSEFLEDDEDKNTIKKEHRVSLHISYTRFPIANVALQCSMPCGSSNIDQ